MLLSDFQSSLILWPGLKLQLVQDSGHVGFMLKLAFLISFGTLNFKISHPENVRNDNNRFRNKNFFKFRALKDSLKALSTIFWNSGSHCELHTDAKFINFMFFVDVGLYIFRELRYESITNTPPSPNQFSCHKTFLFCIC